jgi:hypothetical protein
MNEAIKELLDNPKPAAVVEPARTLEELGAFAFDSTKDAVGLPLACLAYAKDSCKRCHGRGYQILFNSPYRSYKNCGCVAKGYAKARRGFDEIVADAVRSGKTPDQAAAIALAATIG